MVYPVVRELAADGVAVATDQVDPDAAREDVSGDEGDDDDDIEIVDDDGADDRRGGR